MKLSNCSRVPECLDLVAIQDAMAMVAAGLKVTAQAQVQINVAFKPRLFTTYGLQFLCTFHTLR